MAVVPMEPVRELLSIQERMNRMFDDAFRAGGEQGDRSIEAVWAPAADVYEANGDIVIEAELPGIAPEKVDIKVEGTVLMIKGQRGFDQGVARESYHRIERAYGPFSRAFTLPSSVDQDGISANYRDGILLVRLPKQESAKPRQIRIGVQG